MAIVVFFALAAAGVTGDLLSKHYVFKSLLSAPELPGRAEETRKAFQATYNRNPTGGELLKSLHLQRQVAGGVKFTLLANAGVVFGAPIPPWVVTIATIAAVALVGYFFATTDRRAWTVHVSLAFILGGALGNFYDRLFSSIVLPGAEPIRYNVRDFIDCSELYYPWVFNVADVLLVVGVAILILRGISAGRTGHKKASGKA